MNNKKKNLHFTYLSVLLRRFESNSQLISGVGLPEAIHFKCKDTPGCIVLSLKYSLICGGSTVKVWKLILFS